MAQAETREAIDQAARMLALDVPEPCYAGIAQNMALLSQHVAVLQACPAEDDRPA